MASVPSNNGNNHNNPINNPNKDLSEFPDVEAKLQKPSKQSAFEKQKAEAEAKRKREAAETAAVYESFVKSFDNEDDFDGNADGSSNRGDRGGFSRQQGGPFGRSGPGGMNAAFGGGASRRHFGAGSGTGLKSGPGSLGPPPSAFGKKRAFDSFQQGSRDANATRGRLGFHDDDNNQGGSGAPSKSVAKVFDTSDDEGDARTRDLAEEKAIAKPTLRLSNLPPGVSPGFIKALIPTNLTVENVKIIPPSGSAGSSSSERKSMSCIVTLSKETPATDIDAAVSSLQNKYLGYGFYLSLHRHLSSAVATTAVTSSLASLNATSHAFGAKPVPQAGDNNTYHGGGYRGFAPPSSYSGGGGPLQRTILHVPVSAPKDIKQLQLIHKVVESVLQHGPDFEALLMSRPDVQKEEKWAWLWDARSEGGVWYRWRLWEILTGARNDKPRSRQARYLPLFEGSHAWKMPERGLAYEYTTAIDEFASDPEYNSSDEEDFEDEQHPQQQQQQRPDGGENEISYLNPLDKAKLTHLLARLPTTLTRIRKGDIARVTSFAITHASRRADEIVDMIVANIARPYVLTSANPQHKKNNDKPAATADGGGDPLQGPTPTATADDGGAQDTSGASLVGLYAASDILSSSATSAVRHAWRYRQLFEAALRRRATFAALGRLPERRGWGRLRAEKWRRAVGLVLALWEGWCAFPHESQALFVRSFENPPQVGVGKEGKERSVGVDADGHGNGDALEDAAAPKKGGKWKTVEAGAGTGTADEQPRGFKLKPFPSRASERRKNPYADPADDDLDGEAMDDGDGNGYGNLQGDDYDDEMPDVDVEELDSDIDGVPMDDDDEDGEPMDQDQDQDAGGGTSGGGEGGSTDPAEKSAPEEKQKREQTRPEPRRRPRAVDMFADSDGSDGGR